MYIAMSAALSTLNTRRALDIDLFNILLHISTVFNPRCVQYRRIKRYPMNIMFNMIVIPSGTTK
jgi:hypothetical protein